ncbi:SH3 domain-containing protein [Alistipes senegalensis]|uniref:SH3 domain-containing protein n=1 Tax=Alistipes senegalensis TaxID=1288121 RepID=UPI0018A9E2EB|nr:SH3 domain-containing protein [Alistipes senegalensis]
MKNKILLTCLLALLVIPCSTWAKKVSSVCTDIVLRSRPEEGAPVVGRVPAGETVTLLETVRPDFWVKVEGPDGSVGYVDSGALDSPSGIESEETTSIKQVALPRGGAYRVTREGMRVYLGKPASRDFREEVYSVGDVIEGAKYINDEWLAIPLKEGVQGYVQRKYLHKLKLYELVREYGEEAPIVAAERELIARTPRFSLFNGWKAGLYGLWLIIAAAVALLVMTYSAFGKNGSAEPKTLVRYGLLLAVISVIELWYFLTLGVDDAAWFLGRRAGDMAWVNFFIMLAVTAVQGFGIFKYIEEVQEHRRIAFSQRWMFVGVLLSLVLYGIFLLSQMNDEIPSRIKAPALVACAFLGQIPQLLAMLWGFFRGRQRQPGPPSLAGMLVTYWIAVTGMICLGALSVGLLIAMALGALLMIALARQMPSMFYDAAQSTLADTARHGKYTAAFNLLDQKVHNGTMDPLRAREIRNRLEELKDQGKNCPEKLDF